MEWLNNPENIKNPITRDSMDSPCYNLYAPNDLDKFCLIRFCGSRGSCSKNNCAFYFG